LAREQLDHGLVAIGRRPGSNAGPTDAARASAAIPATAPAQIGRKRLMASTMPDASRNIWKKPLKPGHNSVTADQAFR
jgi:hypothetical protein